jgi:hypothetical protein
MIEIIDDFLPELYANQLEHDAQYELMYKFLPMIGDYTLSDDVHLHENDENAVDLEEFCCRIYDAKVETDYKFGYYLSTIKPILYAATSHLGFRNMMIDRAKVNLLLKQPTFKDTQYHIPHVDIKKHNHYTLVYYINDSDGDTWLFNEFWDPDLGAPESLTFDQRISPKKNRAVIFESNRYHSSSNPTQHDTRYVLSCTLKLF